MQLDEKVLEEFHRILIKDIGQELTDALSKEELNSLGVSLLKLTACALKTYRNNPAGSGNLE